MRRGKFIMVALFGLTLNTAPAHSQSATVEKDGIGFCQNFFLSQGETVFTSRLDVRGAMVRSSLAGSLLKANQETTITLVFPDEQKLVEETAEKLDYYLTAISANSQIMGVRVIDPQDGERNYYIAFPLEAVMPDGGCSRIRLHIS